MGQITEGSGNNSFGNLLATIGAIIVPVLGYFGIGPLGILGGITIDIVIYITINVNLKS